MKTSDEKVYTKDEVKIMIENAYNEAHEPPSPTFFMIFFAILITFLIFVAMIFGYIKKTYGDDMYNITWNLFWNDLGFFGAMGAAAIWYYAKMAAFWLFMVYAGIVTIVTICDIIKFFWRLIRDTFNFFWRQATTCRQYNQSWDKLEQPYEVKV